MTSSPTPPKGTEGGYRSAPPRSLGEAKGQNHELWCSQLQADRQPEKRRKVQR